MRKIWNKGHRIRASDKHLVYHFSIGTLLFVFVAVLLLLNIKQLMRTDWEHFSLFENGLTLSPYNFITILIATGVCALVAFLYYRFCYDSFKKLLHRQKLARMILENKWYEADTVQDSGFFTDLQSRSREKIVWFPKIYYQMVYHILCYLWIDIGNIFKRNHITIHKNGFRYDSCRNSIFTDKWFFIYVVWLLYCIFFIITRSWERVSWFLFRSLSARNLFHTCNSDSSSILGNQRHYVRPANR